MWYVIIFLFICITVIFKKYTLKRIYLRFDGVPVLFLPGNSGSHMQARSLASVALRKALAKAYDYHFDYFTSKLYKRTFVILTAMMMKNIFIDTFSQ